MQRLLRLSRLPSTISQMPAEIKSETVHGVRQLLRQLFLDRLAALRVVAANTGLRPLCSSNPAVRGRYRCQL